MVAAVGNNLPCTVAGDNDAVEWFLMLLRECAMILMASMKTDSAGFWA